MGKDRAAQIWAKQALYNLVRELQRSVSAGELARHMGISRNTADKRLRELWEENEIEVTRSFNGRVTCYRYCPKSNKIRPAAK